jgi:hypothetical protein
MIAWLVLGFVSLVFGIALSPNGSVMVGVACFFAILARIAQANAHQRVYLEALAARTAPPTRD